ncbi:cytochrome c' [Geothermobacter ehrlichii]|uniref:Cytochrome c n=1 Tax=Geothermobacter ehrlichii TaxID=213224 RepID=A0A5D3WH35_9BACT|nr:cytochrome c [Geothermobacter ehrlichii]TYO96396.1 cytochrome c' [Geothermobacter ehrlichii]
MFKATGLGKVVIATVAIASVSLFSAAFCLASDTGHGMHPKEQAAGVHLSPDVKAILNEEMRGIEGGMIKIITAISTGDWKTIATTGEQIRDSFILKQKLTSKQMNELHRALPADFVAMDRSFHAAAGKLARAAHRHDGELVSFYFYKLHSQCISCHSRYATERFPDLKQEPKSDHH